jgi:exodeoxyribonuclease-5
VTVTLTPHQEEALNWLVDAVEQSCARREPALIALRGFAGTGKTTLIPALRDALWRQGWPVAVGSPTHRAAMILRRKGIDDADTVHAHALMPYFKPDYRRAARWLGDLLPARLDEIETPHDDIAGLPWLIHEAVQPDLAKAHNLRRTGERFKAKKLLQSIGINGKDHFAGFGPKVGDGVLIIDEASMIGEKMLTICQEAYRYIILVGDPGQLPPVKDVAQLAKVPGRDLTEIHRQAVDSPIRKLAYKVREGARLTERDFPLHDLDDLPNDAVYRLPHAQASAFLEAPLIVWKNLTRVECTHAIRAALGFTKAHLAPGEPLVCRSTSQEDRADGFYNNGLYRLVEVLPDDPRRAVVENALGDTTTILLHMEELDGDMINPRAVPFRFGYCLTAHTAQGGEWPIVYISMLDYQKYAASCLRYGRAVELAQWTYTAITRAKETLCLLTNHHFLPKEDATMAPTKQEKLAPPSTPMLGMTPTPTVPDVADDIADPKVPATLTDALRQEPALPDKFGEHEALLQGFCQHFQRRFDAALAQSGKDAMRCLEDMHGYIKRQLEMDQEKIRHAETALDQLLTKIAAGGIALRHDPYEASIQAMSPQGFRVTVAIKKGDPEDLIDKLPALIGWLAESGYTAIRS